MTKSTRTMHTAKLRTWAIVISLALALGALPVVASGSTQVTDVEVQGSTVYVTLQNSGSSMSTGVVEVTATVLGLPVRSASPFKAPANGLTRVAVQFVGQVGDVIVVGISDDSGPV